MFSDFGFLGGGSPTTLPNQRLSQDGTYKVILAPTTLPLTIDEVKQQLNMALTDLTFDSYITLLIETVRDFFEGYTNRILINTGFLAYFTGLVMSYELERSALVSLDSFVYLNVDDIFVEFDDTTYYLTDETDYSRILFRERSQLPTDKKDEFQSININFTAGYGPTAATIPTDIKLAMLNHITLLFANRGDCSCAATGNAFDQLPATTRMIYGKYQRVTLYGDGYRGAF